MIRPMRVHFRLRDSQRQRVYNAERALDIWHRASELFRGDGSLDKTQRYVNKVTRSRFWRKLLAENGVRRFKYDVTVYDGRGSRSARSLGRSSIAVPRWARSPMVILHELAHCAAPPGVASHGREFCSTYLKLVRRFIGKQEADALRQAFRGFHVRHLGVSRVPLAARPEPPTTIDPTLLGPEGRYT